MKKIMLFSVVIAMMSFTSAPIESEPGWEVPRYYIKPIKNDPRSVVLKPMAKKFNGPIQVDFCVWDQPCDGSISVKVSCTYTDVVDRQFTLTIGFTRNGQTSYVANYITMVAYSNVHYIFMPTYDYTCSYTLSPRVSWFVL